jgi:hypothetical protein
MAAIAKMNKRAQINKPTEVASSSSASLVEKGFLCFGGAEKRSPKIRMIKKTGNQDTPHITGPKGTTQKCPTSPPKNNTRKSINRGITDSLFLYGENKKAINKASINIPKIPMFNVLIIKKKIRPLYYQGLNA